METFDYSSVYDRVAIRATVREALQVPRMFALWGRQELGKNPAMNTWLARQWFVAFLEKTTGIPWIVEELTLDLAMMPRHKAFAPRQKGEFTTDDPALHVPLWVEGLIEKNVSGAAVVRFIDTVITPSPYELPPSDKRRPLPFAS